MKDARALVPLAAIACVAALAGRPALANDAGYNVWFAGRVVSVDARAGRMRIARGPTETAGRAVEDCFVTGADLTLVRPGMRVEAQADTRRRPWRVLHLHVMRLRREPAANTPVAFALSDR